VRGDDEPCLVTELVGQFLERHDPHAHSARVASGRERREHAGVLLVAREDLVAGVDLDRVQHGVDAVGGRPGER
jgi:hypothetical protein